MSSKELTARINRFMDRKVALRASITELEKDTSSQSHRKLMDVTSTPYIQLAIK